VGDLLDVEGTLRPWLGRIERDTGPLGLYDAHTHMGRNDPDGFKQDPADLVVEMEAAGARAVVFPMHEPDGYPGPNDEALAAAERWPERLVAFCRVNPREPGAVAEARRCLDAGARGIKLHPRAEQFGMTEPAVRDLVALAHERRVPMLIHAGRGIPALGETTVRLCGEFPDATLILAHAAVSDLAWLWKLLPERPNILIDTAWGNPVDHMALFALAPPANIVFASDSPYGTPIASAVMTLRCALQAGVPTAVLPSIAGGTLARVLDGQRPEDLGPPPGPPTRAIDPLVERVVSYIGQAFGRMIAGGSPVESLGLARLACAVGDDHPDAEVFAAVLGLLDLYEEHIDDPVQPNRRFPPAARLLSVASYVARTPWVPVPGAADTPPPTSAVASAGDLALGDTGPEDEPDLL
jgi:predicted TIM-barrel fold metal-dependent hydrolase